MLKLPFVVKLSPLPPRSSGSQKMEEISRIGVVVGGQGREAEKCPRTRRWQSEYQRVTVAAPLVPSLSLLEVLARRSDISMSLKKKFELSRKNEGHRTFVKTVDHFSS